MADVKENLTKFTPPLPKSIKKYIHGKGHEK